MPKGDIWAGDAAEPGTATQLVLAGRQQHRGSVWGHGLTFLQHANGLDTNNNILCCVTAGCTLTLAITCLLNGNLYMCLTLTHSISTEPPEHGLEEPPPTTAQALLSPSWDCTRQDMAVLSLLPSWLHVRVRVRVAWHGVAWHGIAWHGVAHPISSGAHLCLPPRRQRCTTRYALPPPWHRVCVWTSLSPKHTPVFVAQAEKQHTPLFGMFL